MRLLIALLLLAAAIAGGAFFAGHPGQVEITWQSWQIETSVGVLIAAVAAVALVVMLLALGIAALRRVPRNLRRRRATRKRLTGEAALTRGLVALAAGDAAGARRHAARAATLIDRSPTVLLLSAEAAQRQGDTAAARAAYTALAADADSEFLGLRGLIGQALRDGDDAAARRLAERARLLRPEARWLVDSLVVLQARAGDWAAAHDTLAGAARRRALAADTARHQRGVVLYELSRAAERRDALREAAGLAARAQAAAPDLAPLATHHARLLAALGRHRAAAKALERAWRQAPHPELATGYAALRPQDGALARTAALQRLAAGNPDMLESRLALGEAAIDAQLWGEARRHLDAAAAPGRVTRQLCLLMARLEEGGAGDLAAARQWLDRALGAPPDPCYVCDNCGNEAAEWQPLCPVCGSFDRLAWRTPARPSQGRAAGRLTEAGAPLMLPSADMPGASRLAPDVQSDN